MNLQNLFNHQSDKKGFVTVMNVLLKDVTTGEPKLKLDSLKISNISVEGSEKEIRGGLGAGLLMTYGYGRTATVEIEDAFASMDSLQYMFGSSSMEEDGELVYNVNKSVTTDASGIGALVPAPVVVKGKPDAYGVTSAGVTVYYDSATGGGTWTTSFTDGGAGADTYGAALSAITAIDAYYETLGSGGAKSLTLKSTDFPEAVVLVGHTFLIDETDGKKILCEIEIPRFKLDPNFNLSLEGEGDASTFNFTGKALENNDNEILKLKMIGEYDLLSPIV